MGGGSIHTLSLFHDHSISWLYLIIKFQYTQDGLENAHYMLVPTDLCSFWTPRTDGKKMTPIENKENGDF